MSSHAMPFLSPVVLGVVLISLGCRSEPQSSAAGITPADATAAETVQEPSSPQEQNRALNHSGETNSAVMINRARTLLEAGRFDEAKGSLKEVGRNDLEARAAHYYLTLIEERHRYDERNQNSERNRIILTGAPKRSRLGDQPLPRFEPKWEALREMPPTDNLYRLNYKTPVP